MPPVLLSDTRVRQPFLQQPGIRAPARTPRMVHTDRQGGTVGNKVAAPAYGTSSKGAGKRKYYAIARGHKVGIFDDWSSVQKLVDGFPGCRHKSFPSRQLAEEYLQANGVTLTQTVAAPPSLPPPPKQQQQQQQQRSSTSAAPQSAAGSSRRQGQAPAAQPIMSAPVEPDDSAAFVASALAMQPPAGLRQPMVQVNEALTIDPGRLYRLEFDGASRGNPGPAGAGAYLCQAADDTEIAQAYQYIGRSCTNNVAEYSALILGLKIARDLGIRRLAIYGDSELVIRQMEGRYRVNNENMKLLYAEATALRQQFQECTITHVLRELNTRADLLSNMALDLKS